MSPDAVVFDFDGTLVDTEWPIFLTAQRALAVHDVLLREEDWASVVGLSDAEGGWYDALRARLGLDLPRAEFDRAYERAQAEGPTARDDALLREGVVELLDLLAATGVPLAVASGSGRAWLEHHLEGRFDLVHRFSALVGVDHPDVAAGKPAPDLYRVACRELGVDPVRVVAVEDTNPGVVAARAAGVGAVLAVPGPLTRFHDLDAADRVVPTLAGITPADLDDLLAGAPR